jgi:hypothetical protein
LFIVIQPEFIWSRIANLAAFTTGIGAAADQYPGRRAILRDDRLGRCPVPDPDKRAAVVNSFTTYLEIVDCVLENAEPVIEIDSLVGPGEKNEHKIPPPYSIRHGQEADFCESRIGILQMSFPGRDPPPAGELTAGIAFKGKQDIGLDLLRGKGWARENK